MFVRRLFVQVFISFVISGLIGKVYGQYSTPEVFTPVQASSGKILYHPENPQESAVYLGAALGYFSRFGFSAGYNYLPDGSGYWGSFFFPTEIGTLGFSLHHSAADAGYSGIFRAGFGKRLTRDLVAGFHFNFRYYQPGSVGSVNGNMNSVGFEPSIAYKIAPVLPRQSPVGIHLFYTWAGFSGLDIRGESSPAAVPLFFMGLGARIFSIDRFRVDLGVESSIDTEFRIIPLSSVLKLQYHFFQLRAGYRYLFPVEGGQGGTGSLSLGAGLDFNFEKYSLNIQYGIDGLLDSSIGHYVSVNSYFNTVDVTAPVLTVKPVPEYFSPNSDGIQDLVSFKIKVKDASPLRDWEMIIKNEKGEVVRKFSKDNRTRRIVYPVYRILTDLFRRNEYRFVPETIVWDGRGESTGTTADTVEDPRPIDLPDGAYFYEMLVTDSRGNLSNTSGGTVYLDRKKPEVNLERHRSAESTATGIFFSATQSLPAEESLTARGIIRNSYGQVVRSWNFNRENISRLEWDGISSNSRPVPEGYYHYTLEVTDPAGNTYRGVVSHIGVVRPDREIRVESDVSGFSPNGDQIGDDIPFTVRTNMPRHDSWVAYVTYARLLDDRKVLPVYKWEGGKEAIPEKFIWDGKKPDGALADTRKYYFTIIARDGDKNNFSRSIPFVLDRKSPVASLFPDKAEITPDGDGIDDDLNFFVNVSDDSAIRNYELSVYEVRHTPSGKILKLFRRWSADGRPPEKIYFDGISEQGNLMESLHEYECHLVITDIYGNRSNPEKKTVRTGILVHKKEKTLRIILSGLRFRQDGYPAQPLLIARVYALLSQDYPTYRFRIEGHTASPGDEEENIVSSENRAMKIFEYFVSLGLQSGRAGYQGYGEIVPLTELENEDAWYKNERIEIILIP